MAQFPPKSWQDIFAYDDDEIVAGFREYRHGEREPPHGYRWGWSNRRRDNTGDVDEHHAVRMEYIRNTPSVFDVVH